MESANQKMRNTNQSKSQESRPTIGFLICDIMNLVGQAEWLGVADAAREHGANLICFAGDALRHPDGFHAQANVLYDLVNDKQLDGLVIWTAMLDWFVSHEEMEDFIKGFHPLHNGNTGCHAPYHDDILTPVRVRTTSDKDAVGNRRASTWWKTTIGVKRFERTYTLLVSMYEWNMRLRDAHIYFLDKKRLFLSKMKRQWR